MTASTGSGNHPTSGLRASQVELSYGSTHALRGVDVTLSAGEFRCILGPNGSGKSSLLHTLVGLVQPDAGKITLDGNALSDLSPAKRARSIGFLPQEIHPAFSFTVAEAVALGARVAGHGSWFDASPDDETQNAIHQALATVEATHLAERRLDELSGGERRRVLLAGGLAQEPQFLLLDEPAAMLDLHHQASLFRLLKTLAQKGIGVLCVTHDWNLASHFADELILLHEGRVHAKGVASEVLTDSTLLPVFGENYELIARQNRPPVVIPK